MHSAPFIQSPPLLGNPYRDGGEIDNQQRALFRTITPIAKLVIATQAAVVVSEYIEAFGAAGYVEDTGLPILLRDAQVLPCWQRPASKQGMQSIT